MFECGAAPSVSFSSRSPWRRGGNRDPFNRGDIHNAELVTIVLCGAFWALVLWVLF